MKRHLSIRSATHFKTLTKISLILTDKIPAASAGKFARINQVSSIIYRSPFRGDESFRLKSIEKVIV